MALCLSGGGTRNASFALGILQALAAQSRLCTPEEERAKHPEEEWAKRSLLAQFNYLSTVSGGGYIGGWLSAWVSRNSYCKVWKDFVRIGDRERDSGEELAPLGWLRSHSSHLTPKRGLSGNTMAVIAHRSAQSVLELVHTSAGTMRCPVGYEAVCTLDILRVATGMEDDILLGATADLVRFTGQHAHVHTRQPPPPNAWP